MKLDLLQFQQHHEFCRCLVVELWRSFAGETFVSHFTMGFHPDGRISEDCIIE